MQPQVQMQQPITLHLQQVQANDVKPRHKHKTALDSLGRSEVVFGIISVILGFATLIIAPQNFFSRVSQGIWCGVFLIVTGILGIQVKSNPSACMYIANMAMSIITANIMVPFMVLSGVAAAHYSHRYNNEYYMHDGLAALYSINVIVGFAAAVVCIVHSAYCCAGICCCRTPYSRPVTYTSQPYGVQRPQQVVTQPSVQPSVPQGYTVTPNAMIPGQVYQPPQGGAAMSQTTMTGQPRFMHQAAASPPLGSYQPFQVSTIINAPQQGLSDVPYPTSTAQVEMDVNRNQAPDAKASPGYSP